MEITPACYSHFTNSLMGLANGRVAVVLDVCDKLSECLQIFKIKFCFHLRGDIA